MKPAASVLGWRAWLIAAAAGLWMALTAQADTRDAFQHGQAPLTGLGGPLNLIDQQQQPFSLSRLGSQPALVFFGFTRCATACPPALLQAREFLAQFKARKAPPVLFVTLDPLSDDPASLGRFLGAIDPRITGLTGTPDQIHQAARRYGVATQGSSIALEHSARWYVVNAQATLLRVYSSQDSGTQMASDLTRWQQQQTQKHISLGK
jgi:protein SCO1